MSPTRAWVTTELELPYPLCPSELPKWIEFVVFVTALQVKLFPRVPTREPRVDGSSLVLYLQYNAKMSWKVPVWDAKVGFPFSWIEI